MTRATSPHELFDAILDEHKIENDKTLAARLQISNSSISKMRTGGFTSDALRLAVMRTFNWPLKRIDELAPPEYKAGQ